MYNLTCILAIKAKTNQTVFLWEIPAFIYSHFQKNTDSLLPLISFASMVIVFFFKFPNQIHTKISFNFI